MINKKEYQKEWRAKNKERFNESKKKWNEKNKDKVRIMNNNYSKKTRDKNRVRLQTWRKYGPVAEGFQRHHFEYSVDSFILVETGIHKWLHDHGHLSDGASRIGKCKFKEVN